MNASRTKNQLLQEIRELQHQLTQAQSTIHELRQAQNHRSPGGSDITQRTQADESLQQSIHTLQESEARFRSVLESSLDVAYRRNLKTDRYDYLSPAIEKLVGFSVDEFSTLPFREVLERIHLDDLPHVEEAIERMLTGDPAPTTVEYRLRGKSGEYLWLSDHFAILKDDEDVPLYRVGIIRDITERKESEKRIQDLYREVEWRNTELKAANRELEAFSYSVSHDLRMPLARISGFVRLILDQYDAQLPEEVQRLLRLADESSVRMGDLIQGLHQFSRVGRVPLNKQKVLMPDLVRQALDTLATAQGDHQVEVIIGLLPDAEADPVLLKQVWVNLLSNALKFSRHRNNARIEIGSTPEGDHTVYFVKDNGAGFDMAMADRLFGVYQRFHSAEEYEGTGVGLAIVDRIIRRHGGRVWAEAEVDKGAAFYFTV